MPYEMLQNGHRWVVMNKKTGQVVPGGDHPTAEGAWRHMKALYGNVRDADGVWEVVDGTTGEVMATLADESAARSIADIMLSTGQIDDAEFTAEKMAELGKAGKAFRNSAGEWSYPTPNASYVRKAMQAFGRSNSKDHSRLKAYLKRRAKAEGLGAEEINRIDEYKS